MTVYALLVGIDAYLPPINALYGCRNDMAALEQYLTARVGPQLRLRTLYDDEATRAAVIDAFDAHLARAGRGDVVLFAYAGHGSEEPAPPEVAALEPTGRIQTLLLHDCGRRVGGKLVRALADKELARLLAGAGAGGGHLAVILDCCHSGGGTRDPFVGIRGWRPEPEMVPAESRELVRELAAARPAGDFLPGALEHWATPSVAHVALAACRSYETAKEHRVGDATRGAFSVALLDALDVLGPRTTYRSLLQTVRSRVERSTREQRPELYPVDAGGIGDALFLDGTVTPVPVTFTMARTAQGWAVDAGLVHGLRPPAGDETFVLACTAPDGTSAGAVRVTAVDVGSCTVVPIGWEPADVAYAAVIADVPLPPAEVQIDPPGPDDDAAAVAAVAAAVRAAIAVAGPGASASPYVRIVEPVDAVTAALRLRVGVPAPGAARIMRADASPVTTDVAVTDEAGARRVVARLEHIARWEQVRTLGDHPSPLADAVDLRVYPARTGESRRPADRNPLAAGGGYEFRYERDGDGGWVPPRAFLELVSAAGEDLFVAVLDLTDRFRCHPVLPTVRLAAGHTLALWDGAPIPVSLPADQAVVPGEVARDWLKLMVSDADFEAAAFDLPALDHPVPARAVARATLGTLERLAARAITRDLGAGGAPPAGVARWAAATVAIEVSVP